MPRSSRRLAAAALILLGLSPGLAAAQEQVEIVVTVCHISDQPGPVDPRAAQLHAKLQKQFRYESLRVLDQRSLRLQMNELGTVKLPNGRQLRVRPLNVDDRGVLMSVDVENEVDVDLRAPNRHLTVLSGGDFEDGKLVLSLEPRY